MVAVDTNPRTPNVIDRIAGVTARTIPVCTDTLSRLESFVTSYTPAADSTFSINYANTFMTALNLFNVSIDSGESLCVCVYGVGLRWRPSISVAYVFVHFLFVVFPIPFLYRAKRKPPLLGFLCSNIEKIFLYLTPGSTAGISNEIATVRGVIESFRNVMFSIYRSFADLGDVFENNFPPVSLW